MDIKFLLGVCFSCCLLQGAWAQEEKIRGNKVVVSDYRELDGFHSIVISKDIQAFVEEDCQNKVEVQADENLLPIITTTVADSILTVTTSKAITSKKSLVVKISYTSMLQRISINDKVELKSIVPIRTDTLWYEANHNTESFLTVSTDKFTGLCTGKSKMEVHLERGNAQLQIHDNARLKGLIIADTLQMELSLKAKATLEGEVKEATVHAKHTTDFLGEKMGCTQLTLTAENDSDCHVRVNGNLTLNAHQASEVYLYGSPSIGIGGFTDKATLYKKPSKVVEE